MIHPADNPEQASFVIAEWTADPAPSKDPYYQAPLHLHHACDEAWTVLEGTLCVRSGDQTHTLTAGQTAFVSHGNAHTFWNPSTTEPCRYLLTMTPLTYRLIESIHSAEDRSPAALKKLFANHNAELL